jgi:hypothetical protein
MPNCTITKERPAIQRALWFVGLWCSGVAVVGAAALVFHVLLLGG